MNMVDSAELWVVQALKISSDSNCYINPMDMLEDYGLTEEDDSETTPIEIKEKQSVKRQNILCPLWNV